MNKSIMKTRNELQRITHKINQLKNKYSCQNLQDVPLQNYNRSSGSSMTKALEKPIQHIVQVAQNITKKQFKLFRNQLYQYIEHQILRIKDRQQNLQERIHELQKNKNSNQKIFHIEQQITSIISVTEQITYQQKNYQGQNDKKFKKITECLKQIQRQIQNKHRNYTDHFNKINLKIKKQQLISQNDRRRQYKELVEKVQNIKIKIQNNQNNNCKCNYEELKQQIKSIKIDAQENYKNIFDIISQIEKSQNETLKQMKDLQIKTTKDINKLAQGRQKIISEIQKDILKNVKIEFDSFRVQLQKCDNKYLVLQQQIKFTRESLLEDFYKIENQDNKLRDSLNQRIQKLEFSQQNQSIKDIKNIIQIKYKNISQQLTYQLTMQFNKQIKDQIQKYSTSNQSLPIQTIEKLKKELMKDIVQSLTQKINQFLINKFEKKSTSLSQNQSLKQEITNLINEKMKRIQQQNYYKKKQDELISQKIQSLKNFNQQQQKNQIRILNIENSLKQVILCINTEIQIANSKIMEIEKIINKTNQKNHKNQGQIKRLQNLQQIEKNDINKSFQRQKDLIISQLQSIYSQQQNKIKLIESQIQIKIQNQFEKRFQLKQKIQRQLQLQLQQQKQQRQSLSQKRQKSQKQQKQQRQQKTNIKIQILQVIQKQIKNIYQYIDKKYKEKQITLNSHTTQQQLYDNHNINEKYPFFEDTFNLQQKINKTDKQQEFVKLINNKFNLEYYHYKIQVLQQTFKNHFTRLQQNIISNNQKIQYQQKNNQKKYLQIQDKIQQKINMLNKQLLSKLQQYNQYFNQYPTYIKQIVIKQIQNNNKFQIPKQQYQKLQKNIITIIQSNQQQKQQELKNQIYNNIGGQFTKISQILQKTFQELQQKHNKMQQHTNIFNCKIQQLFNIYHQLGLQLQYLKDQIYDNQIESQSRKSSKILNSLSANVFVYDSRVSSNIDDE